MTATADRRPSPAIGWLLGCLWLILIWKTSPDWRAIPDYAYGWLVPFLGALLFWRRWTTRPAPESEPVSGAVSTGVILLIFLYPLLRLLQEANSDWRLAAWALALLTSGLTLFTLRHLGGRPWGRHFFFCSFFFLVAVPWPRVIEQTLGEILMPVLAQLSVEGLVWMNIPSIREGSLIEIAGGQIGMEAASGGVRSLQAALMAALFIGELYRFKHSRRIWLVAAGLLLAFLLDAGHAFLLACVAARQGLDALKRFDDPAGLAILGFLFGILWILAILFKGSVAVKPRDTEPGVVRLLPGRLVALLALWLGLSEAGVQGWFLSHESRLVANPRWQIEWPKENRLREVQISQPVRAALASDQARGVEWVAADGSRWAMFFLRWEAGNRAIKAIKFHRPDLCLPPSGRTLAREMGVQVFEVNGHKIPTRWFLFYEHGRPLYGFYCLAEDFAWPGAGPFMETNTRWSLVQRALEGKRSQFPQQILQVFVGGVNEPEPARAAFLKLLQTVVR